MHAHICSTVGRFKTQLSLQTMYFTERERDKVSITQLGIYSIYNNIAMTFPKCYLALKIISKGHCYQLSLGFYVEQDIRSALYLVFLFISYLNAILLLTCSSTAQVGMS